MKNASAFCPTHIIFCPTDSCNLHCRHCFTRRKNKALSAKDAVRFLDSCKNSSIEKVGFSGGEPFLAPDFIAEVSRAALQKGFLFDQIITNGDWWKDSDELYSVLKKIYDAGFDGKISMSFDTFHNQKVWRAAEFIKTAASLFGSQAVSLQCVINDFEKDEFYKRLFTLKELLTLSEKNYTSKKTGLGLIILENSSLCLSVCIQPQTLQSSKTEAWTARKWFKDDFCQGPGNVLFVHADKNVAPCCGFANENPSLFIGTVDETFSQLMEKACKNSLVKTCYEKGLKSLVKPLKKQKLLPGKRCGEICTFCDFVCGLDLKKLEVK